MFWIDALFDLLRKRYNWTECLTHGCYMFQRKSLSSFLCSSNTSLLFYCLVLLFFLLYPLCYCPLHSHSSAFFVPFFCFLLFSLFVPPLVPPPPSLSLQLAYLHVCVLAVWAPSCQNLLCVYGCVYRCSFAFCTYCGCVFCCVCLNYLDYWDVYGSTLVIAPSPLVLSSCLCLHSSVCLCVLSVQNTVFFMHVFASLCFLCMSLHLWVMLKYLRTSTSFSAFWHPTGWKKS